MNPRRVLRAFETFIYSINECALPTLPPSINQLSQLPLLTHTVLVVLGQSIKLRGWLIHVIPLLFRWLLEGYQTLRRILGGGRHKPLQGLKLWSDISSHLLSSFRLEDLNKETEEEKWRERICPSSAVKLVHMHMHMFWGYEIVAHAHAHVLRVWNWCTCTCTCFEGTLRLWVMYSCTVMVHSHMDCTYPELDHLSVSPLDPRETCTSDSLPSCCITYTHHLAPLTLTGTQVTQKQMLHWH